MIRSVAALFVFAVVLCGYIVLRPAPSQVVPIPEQVAVTRAQTDSILAPTAAQEITQAVAGVVQAPERNTAPATAVQTDDSTMDQTAANVLAGLGLTVEPNPNAIKDDPMRQMTTGVLSNIGAITGERINGAGATPAAESPLELLVVRALKEGKSDAYIDTIINEAASAGDISVPRLLVTSDGRVDTAVLLSSIVTQATIAAGGAAPAVPDVPTGDGTGVEVRVVQRATETEQYRFYTVSRGDSLGAIAVKFYGDVNKYDLIYQANRQFLSSPDTIRVGQRLSIPTI